MKKYTFTITEIQGAHGHHYPLLTSNEYPYMNIQVIPTPPHIRDEVMDELNRQHHTVITSDGRTDFCVIQAGGGTPEHPTIHIDQNNYREVAATLLECMQAAADFWASNGEKFTKK